MINTGAGIVHMLNNLESHGLCWNNDVNTCIAGAEAMVVKPLVPSLESR